MTFPPNPQPNRLSTHRDDESLGDSYSIEGPSPSPPTPTLVDLAGNTPWRMPAGVPDRVSRYRLLRFLGSGGFGMVFEAIDESLNRRVAIKLARAHVAAASNLTKRFLDEARTVAGLQHEGILSPLDADVDGGQPFIVYPLCPGPNLAEWLASSDEPVAPRLAAEVMLRLADAVSFSHANFVLHRDIKPANVLLFPASGEVASLPFLPKITDFGLAKSIQLDLNATASTVLLGTPLYLSPEEINGYREVQTSSDVYSLGVVMYELLTRKRPFESDNFFELARLIREQPVVDPRELRKDVPADLAQICVTCLQKYPEDRYRSAKAFADDLKRYLEGESILANPTFWKHQCWRVIDHPNRLTELRAMSIGLSLALVSWSFIGLWLVSNRGEANLKFSDTIINTCLLVALVAAPMSLAAIGAARAKTTYGRSWGLGLGMVTTLLGIIVSLLSFTEHAVVYPEVYGANPVARTIVFTLLLIAFSGLFAFFTLLFGRLKSTGQRKV